MTDVGTRPGSTPDSTSDSASGGASGGTLSTLDSALRAGTLSTFQVFCTAISAATPLTVIAGVVTTGFATTGLLGIPTAFVAVAVVLGVFAPGYLAMTRHVGNTGAFYAYIGRGLGRPVGVAGAGVALLAYNALQVGLYGAVGVATIPLLQQAFGVTVPWWAIAVVAWLVTAALGVLRIAISGRVIAALLVAELLVIVAFSVGNVAHPAGGALSTESLSPSNLLGPGVGAILVLALLGFIGFEAPAIYSEEARDPKRTITRATYFALGLTAVLYTFASWAMTVATGPGNIVGDSREQGQELLFNQAAAHLGGVVTSVGRVLFVTSLLAALISFHNSAARYAFALGREGVLPAVLGRTRPLTGSPVSGSLLQSAFGAVVIAVFAAAHLDPQVQLFFWGGTAGGLGVLMLLTFTSVAVVAHFLRTPATRGVPAENVFTRLVAPLLATVLLAVVLVLALTNMSTLLGVPPGTPIATIIPLVYLLVAVLGFAWALVLRGRRPGVYRAIGRGARTATDTPTDRAAHP